MKHTPLNHLALIPDGNRTWATSQGLPPVQGHLAGEKNTLQLMEYVFTHTRIDVFTIRGLSTENLKQRSQIELDALAVIYEQAIQEASPFMKKNQISLRRIGSPEGMSERLVNVLTQAVSDLTYESEKTVCLGINYGGHDEILRGIKKRHDAGAKTNDLTIEGFGTYLDLHGLPPVDMVIRTKSKRAPRLSGYLLRWIAYAELYFSEALYPDFDTDYLQQALDWFEDIKTHRNFGK